MTLPTSAKHVNTIVSRRGKFILAGAFARAYADSMEKLREYLAGKRKADFAAKLGTSPSYLSQLLSGVKRPGFDMMVRIKQATDGAVTPNDWEQGE